MINERNDPPFFEQFDSSYLLSFLEKLELKNDGMNLDFLMKGKIHFVLFFNLKNLMP